MPIVHRSIGDNWSNQWRRETKQPEGAEEGEIHNKATGSRCERLDRARRKSMYCIRRGCVLLCTCANSYIFIRLNVVESRFEWCAQTRHAREFRREEKMREGGSDRGPAAAKRAGEERRSASTGARANGAPPLKRSAKRTAKELSVRCRWPAAVRHGKDAKSAARAAEEKGRAAARANTAHAPTTAAFDGIPSLPLPSSSFPLCLLAAVRLWPRSAALARLSQTGRSRFSQTEQGQGQKQTKAREVPTAREGRWRARSVERCFPSCPPASSVLSPFVGASGIETGHSGASVLSAPIRRGGPHGTRAGLRVPHPLSRRCSIAVPCLPLLSFLSDAAPFEVNCSLVQSAVSARHSHSFPVRCQLHAAGTNSLPRRTTLRRWIVSLAGPSSRWLLEQLIPPSSAPPIARAWRRRGIVD
jgi:hypothetical protein